MNTRTCPPRALRNYVAVGTALIGLLIASPTFAATDYWTGAANSTWDTTTSNWSSDSAGTTPITFTSSDSVIFSATSVTGASNVTLSAATTVGNLTVNSDETVNISVPSTASLTLTTGNVTVASGSTLTSTGIAFSPAANTVFNIAGTLNADVGLNGNTNFGGIIGSGGSYTVQGGGTLNVAVWNGYLNVTGSGTTVNITGSNQGGQNSGKLKNPTVGVGSTLNIDTSITFGSGAVTVNGTLNILNGSALGGSTSQQATTLTGNGTINGSGTGATLNFGYTSGSSTFAGNITGTLNLNEIGNITYTFNGANTATGSVTVNSGATYVLGSTGSLTFYIGANGVTNKVSGAGTATYNGAFIFNLTSADLTAGNSWAISNVTSQSFSGSFSVQGFTNNNGIWTDNTDGNLTFNQTTGILSYASAIPEPATYGLLGGLAALIAVIAYRRKARAA